jgi:hypothetical protein
VGNDQSAGYTTDDPVFDSRRTKHFISSASILTTHFPHTAYLCNTTGYDCHSKYQLDTLNSINSAFFVKRTEWVLYEV